MPKKCGEKGQVILETAIVLISAAALAISSMVLFSNLNRNMVKRLDKYRDSRVSAVNNPFSLTNSPEAFLDYSPYIEIITQGSEHGDITIFGDSPLGSFDEEFFEDPRLVRAQLLIEQADDIMNIILPQKLGTAYYTDLDGEQMSQMIPEETQISGAYGIVLRTPNLYSYIIGNITRSEAIHARDLCNELVQARANYSQYTQLSVPRAYDNLYEDKNGIDRDRDGFLGAIGLLQSVLNDPIENGPFDPDLDCGPGDQICINRQNMNNNNRNQLQACITNLASTESGLRTWFYGSGLEPGLISRLNTASAELTKAIRYWNLRIFFTRTYYRAFFITKAVVALRIPAESVRAAELFEPPGGTLVDQIKKAYELLEPPVAFEDLIAARSIVYLLNQDPEASVGVIRKLLVDTERFLDYAAGGWWGPDRDRYLDLAREKLEVLYDIVTMAQ
jgi:hypothetical protein